MRWPDLRLPPINLWNAPRLAKKEITVTDLENALARIAELERERDALESEIKDKMAQNLALMRDRDAALEREKALAAHVERLADLLAILVDVPALAGGEWESMARSAISDLPMPRGVNDA